MLRACVDYRNKKSVSERMVRLAALSRNGLSEKSYGAPGAIPTRDLPLRRRTLYATELREHIGFKLTDALLKCPEISLSGIGSIRLLRPSRKN